MFNLLRGQRKVTGYMLLSVRLSLLALQPEIQTGQVIICTETHCSWWYPRKWNYCAAACSLNKGPENKTCTVSHIANTTHNLSSLFWHSSRWTAHSNAVSCTCGASLLQWEYLWSPRMGHVRANAMWTLIWCFTAAAVTKTNHKLSNNKWKSLSPSHSWQWMSYQLRAQVPRGCNHCCCPTLCIWSLLDGPVDVHGLWSCRRLPRSFCTEDLEPSEDGRDEATKVENCTCCSAKWSKSLEKQNL